MTVPHTTVTWRKSSKSSGTDTCVELAHAGWVRDSKHPAGPSLRLDRSEFLAWIKAGRLDP